MVKAGVDAASGLVHGHTEASGLGRDVVGVKVVLRRIGATILGIVDEYWAMREPGQYGDRLPQCEVRCEHNVCVRNDRTP